MELWASTICSKEPQGAALVTQEHERDALKGQK